MDKWSCLWAIIDFVFELQQPKLGCASFVQTPLDAAKQSVLRACTTRVCWHGIYRGYAGGVPTSREDYEMVRENFVENILSGVTMSVEYSKYYEELQEEPARGRFEQN